MPLADNLPLLTLFTAMAAIWWCVLLRYAGLLAVCVLTVLLGIVFGHPFFHVGPITLDRLMFVAVMVSFAFQWRRGQTNPATISASDLPLALLVLIVAASTFLHDWRWNDYLPASRLVFYFAMPAAMYWMARQASASQLAVRRLLLTMAVFGLYLSVTAMAENWEWYWAVFPRYIASNVHAEFLGRGRGPLLNPSGNGVLISTGMCCLWMLWPNNNRCGQLAVVAGTIVFLGGTYATLTRCVWLATALCLLSVILLTFPRRPKYLAVGAILAACSVLIPMNWEQLKSFKRDKNVSAAEMANSAALRPVLAYVAWEIFQDKPLTGVGFGQYKRFDTFYLGNRTTAWPLEMVRPYHQHNIFLSLLTETGLLGMLALMAVLWTWAGRAWKLWRAADVPEWTRRLGLAFCGSLLAYLVNGMFQDVTIMPMVNMFVFLLAGATIGQYEVLRWQARHWRRHGLLHDTSAAFGWSRRNLGSV